MSARLPPSIAVPFAAMIALGGCDRQSSRSVAAVPARAGVDDATRAYGNCVAAAARHLPVTRDTPGNIADSAISSCKGTRATLLPRVRDFYLAGHKATGGYAANVAEASVATLDDDIRTRAVIAVVERQNKARDKTK